MDNKQKISTLRWLLRELYAEDLRSPFPYRGCRSILAETSEEFDGFIPDLAVHCMDIAGFASSSTTVNRWSEVRLTWARVACERSFFQKYPEFQELEKQISPADAPDLYTEMMLHEEMRGLLLELVSLEGERRRERSNIIQKAPTWQQLRQWRFEFAIDRAGDFQYIGQQNRSD